MNNIIKQYKVFIASPSDLKKEREIVSQTCERINQSELVKLRNIRLKPILWEDAAPSAGRPQDTINLLQKNCSIFKDYIGVIIGTKEEPTIRIRNNKI